MKLFPPLTVPVTLILPELSSAAWKMVLPAVRDTVIEFSTCLQQLTNHTKHTLRLLHRSQASIHDLHDSGSEILPVSERWALVGVVVAGGGGDYVLEGLATGKMIQAMVEEKGFLFNLSAFATR